MPSTPVSQIRCPRMNCPAQRVDIDAMMPALIDFIGSFEETVAHGTIEEKRRFLHAFVRQVELDPRKGTGRVELHDLPVFAARATVQHEEGQL